MLDYIVVGLGLSGIAVSSHLEKHNKSFKVYEDFSQKSSLVAGGIYNPVILKRFTPAWNAAQQLETAISFYKGLENQLEAKLVYPINIYRKFNSAEEQNNWFDAADKPNLEDFLDTKLVKDLNPFITSEFSFGRVRKTGVIDTDVLIKEYGKKLEKSGRIEFERFRYADLQVGETELNYNGVKARNIIFCEGFGMLNNPYFNYLPLRGNKGEYLIIYSEELKLKEAIKSSFFILPLGNDLYKVGATYNNHDKDPEPTEEAREQLKKFLERTISCKYEIVDQVSGIRPATADRRPLVGRHPEFENMYACNGFGSRGVLIAPTMADELIEHIGNGKDLSGESDLKRFTRKHYKAIQ
ncbi:NAD(P)/FAD-dependent oxidoreductase [Salegentibacter chungangensis]|uniref:NAD(P)/FAD-dependent oxidoreductase n=1 Tax=Salegentibacter chungangensis TaxID=1335724 RepID=A0ABW3NML8_9FLAO